MASPIMVTCPFVAPCAGSTDEERPRRTLWGNRPMRVLLFGTCLVDTFFPGVGEATVRLLRRFGAEPVFPKGQTCCGQPAFNAGHEDTARAAAAHFLSVFDGDDPIVT